MNLITSRTHKIPSSVLIVFIALLHTNRIAHIKCEIVNSNKITGRTVRVNKCCEENELYIGASCRPASESNETVWRPVFSTENGNSNVQVDYTLVPGSPDCGSKQLWPISHMQNSNELLRLLTDGVLRHYSDGKIPDEENVLEVEYVNGKSTYYHDYEPGKYCLEKKINGGIITEFAWVCASDHEQVWTNTKFFMRNIVNPVTHLIGIGCLLTVAIIYFVLPTLRDLVGNIITTICMCLIVSQTADLIRLLTVFNNHTSLIITETICYISMLGAFFWLNSLGYYIWKTFKSRNVFLRITDGKKYCYYSSYSWSCTVVLGVLAVFAHFTMDYPVTKRLQWHDDQEEIGSLGIIIFFVPVAFTILMDIFFFATTVRILNRMHTYGRIHHKLRHSFRMFILLLLTMTITWLFFLMSFLKFDGLTNGYLIVNAFQGPIVLYICVMNQKHVSYLLHKTCCYKTYCLCKCCRPEPEAEWGDEMSAMNTTIY